MYDNNALNEEVKLIKDDNIRKLTLDILKELPEYFWKIPASSSGKYHSKHSLGEGGLVRHVKCAVRIAESLFTITPFEARERDIIISALLLHDGMKSGKVNTGNTVHEHPNLITEFIMNSKFDNVVDIMTRISISNAIMSHMGQWNVSKYSDIVLEKPQTKVQRFVHMCDYLASRKFLNMDLEG